MLTCENLWAVRNNKRLFYEWGCTIGDGAIVVVKGPNGCGKSTLLRMMAGLRRPDRGDIYWGNYSIFHFYDEYCPSRQYLGHRLGITPEQTVLQNIEFFASLAQSPQMVAPAIHYFDLQEKMNIPCHQLSMGWLKRVALARVMACYSKIWLLDEPYTHLDDAGKRSLSHLITTRTKEGGIVILTSHETLSLDYTLEVDLNLFKEDV
ncbi:MAG: heme ABC exporter ATP-binding protein CcmA [Alphaproteobacteria bacterium]|nr:heme ABC exporter ATP-binding protein CcmA [Alphaproteobacteria bacterium]